MEQQQSPPSPMRLLEILKDRFGALEAVANSSIKLARYAPEDELAMDSRRGIGAGVRQQLARGEGWSHAVGTGGGTWHRLREACTAAAGGSAAAARFVQRPDAKDIAGATNYVRAALDAGLAGRPIAVAQAQPYGCEVKY